MNCLCPPPSCEPDNTSPPLPPNPSSLPQHSAEPPRPGQDRGFRARALLSPNLPALFRPQYNLPTPHLTSDFPHHLLPTIFSPTGWVLLFLITSLKSCADLPGEWRRYFLRLNNRSQEALVRSIHQFIDCALGQGQGGSSLQSMAQCGPTQGPAPDRGRVVNEGALHLRGHHHLHERVPPPPAAPIIIIHDHPIMAPRPSAPAPSILPISNLITPPPQSSHYSWRMRSYASPAMLPSLASSIISILSPIPHRFHSFPSLPNPHPARPVSYARRPRAPDRCEHEHTP